MARRKSRNRAADPRRSKTERTPFEPIPLELALPVPSSRPPAREEPEPKTEPTDAPQPASRVIIIDLD